MDIPRKDASRKRLIRRIIIGLVVILVVVGTSLGLNKLKPAAQVLAEHPTHTNAQGRHLPRQTFAGSRVRAEACPRATRLQMHRQEQQFVAAARVEGHRGAAAQLIAQRKTHDVGAATPRDLAHAFPEHAVDADDRGVARFEEVDEARLHARGAGCRAFPP